MAFIFTCGTHTFQSLLKGYENITVQCQNCGNWSGRIVKRWEWFTFCFVPIIPFSLKPWHAVGCHICRFQQDLKFRPDVQQQMENGGAGSQVPLQNGPPQGWGANGHGPPLQQQGVGAPPDGQQPQYQPPQGLPQYK